MLWHIIFAGTQPTGCICFVFFEHRVMSFIEKSVARLDQLERLDSLAVELGRSHYRYYAPPKYYGVRE